MMVIIMNMKRNEWWIHSLTNKDTFMESVELCFVRHLAKNNYSITKRIVAKEFDDVVDELCDIRWNDILRNEMKQYRKERRQRRFSKINPILLLMEALFSLMPKDEFKGRYRK